jgi:uncharacterized protein YjbJ (UPF0337 family)
LVADGDIDAGADPAGSYPSRDIHGRFTAAQINTAMTDKNWTEKGIEDSAEGKAKDLKGKIKDAAGSLTGDTSLEAEGKLDQLKGKTQDTLGKIERKIGEADDDV